MEGSSVKFFRDIPEFLILNSFSNKFRGNKIVFPDSTDICSDNSDLFVSAGEYLEIFENNPRLHFDLVINTHSFMEMSNDTVNKYFDLCASQFKLLIFPNKLDPVFNAPNRRYLARE